MEAIEPLTRAFCVRALDPLVGSGRFDFVENLGSMVPMRTIGYLLGIPEDDQESIRDRGGSQLTLKKGTFRVVPQDFFEHSHQMFSDYIDWRVDHPSDDLMTQLLNAELEDDEGTRRLTRIGGAALHQHDRRCGQRDDDTSDRFHRPTPRRAPRPASARSSTTRR